MAETLKQIEWAPAQWPARPPSMSVEAAMIAPAIIWARLEHYTAQRFSARDIQWIVEGPGNWEAPLSPATITTVERWVNGAWQEDAALSASPLGGYVLSGCGPYRFTGTVGAGPVPEIVNQAYRRLAEYFAASDGRAGLRAETVQDIGSFEYDLNAVASALQKSGAADLLRGYRRPQ
jgi:hypothetical protein